MCFSAPKPPKPPRPPQPPSPRDESLKSQQDELRRRQNSLLTSSGTVLTSPMGDPGYGSNAAAPTAGGSVVSGTRLGGR
jgi:hypothetical protein